MTVAAISTNLYPLNNSTLIPPHNNVRLRLNIGKLGEDLQSGNLSAAQQDFATLQQSASLTDSTVAPRNNPVAQAVNQLSEELRAGSPAAAQNIAGIQTSPAPSAQTAATEGHPHHHRHSVGGTESRALFNQLSQDLESGSLDAAQVSYGSILRDLSLSPATAPGPAAVSLNA